MMAARPRFDPDSAYIIHPRSGQIVYEPLPTDTLRQLARLGRLIRTAPNVEEAAWLEAQIDAITVECADCPPCPVRHIEPPAPRKAHWFNSRGKRS